MTKEEKVFFEALTKRGNVDTAKKCILATPNLLMSRDERHRTPIMVAAANNNHIMVDFLLEQKVDLSSTDREGNTVLHFAGRVGNEETIELLLNHHAPFLVLNALGYSMLHELAFGGHTPAIYRLECYLSPYVRSLLIHSCSTKEPADGKMAIHLAAMQKDHNVTLALLKFGANPNAVQNHHYTPLHYAASRNYFDQTVLLLTAGATTSSQLNGKSIEENKQLLIQAETKNKETVLQMARRMGKHEVADYLSSETLYGQHRYLVKKRGSLYSDLVFNNDDDDNNHDMAFLQVNHGQVLDDIISTFLEKDIFAGNLLILQKANFEALVNVCKRPAQLIKRKDTEIKRSSSIRQAVTSTFRGKDKKQVLSSSSIDAIRDIAELKVLKPLFYALETTLLQSDLPLTVAIAIQSLLTYYQKFCQDYQEGGQAQDKYYNSIYVYRDGEVIGILRPGFRDKIFPFDENDNVVVDERSTLADEGSHVVIKYENLFFKFEPTAPSVEYAIDCLYKSLDPSTTTENRLLVFHYNNLIKPALVSLAVNGMSFRKLLDTQIQDVCNLEHNSFSAHAILHMISNPADAKSDNFIAVNIGTKQNPCYQLTDIDHDENFGSELVAVKAGVANEKDHMTNIRSIIFLLPQMLLPIAPKIRQSFLVHTPEEWIIGWVAKLLKKNQSYRALIDAGLLSDAQISELGIPLCFTKNTLLQLYNKIDQITKILQQNPDITLNELFEEVLPVVYYYFSEISKRATEERDAESLLYRSEAIQDLMNTDTFEKRLKYEHKKMYDYQSRNEELTVAIENWIESLDLAQFSPERQRRFYTLIENLPIKFSKLSLYGCNQLSCLQLSTLLSEGLTTLILDKFGHINGTSLGRILSNHSRLILVLGSSDHFSADEFCSLYGVERDRLKILVNRQAHAINKMTLHNAAKECTLKQLEWLVAVDKQFMNGQAKTTKDERGFGIIHRIFSEDQRLTLNKLVHLMQAGFDLTLPDSDYRDVLYYAASRQYMEVIEWLVGLGYKFSITPGKTNALHAAVTTNNAKLVRLILSLKGYEKASNCLDATGKSPLIHACFTGSVDIALILLEFKADINLRSSYGYTPLLAALKIANERLISVLIDHKADLTVKGPEGHSIMELARQYNLDAKIIAMLESELPITPQKPHENVASNSASM